MGKVSASGRFMSQYGSGVGPRQLSQIVNGPANDDAFVGLRTAFLNLKMAF
jgi:hypothetical protein